jgi:hypothetical protein
MLKCTAYVPAAAMVSAVVCAISPDPYISYFPSHQHSGFFPFAYNDGRCVTDALIHHGLQLSRSQWLPLLKKAIDQSVGARREWATLFKNNCGIVIAACFVICHNSLENVSHMRASTDAEFGENNELFADSVRQQSFQRHHTIARKCVWNYK